MQKKKFTIPQLCINGFILIFALICILPMLLILISSFASQASLTHNGYTFFPSEWSLEAYKYVFQSEEIWRAYAVTIFITIIGTIGSVFITYSAGYTLANRNCLYRNELALFFFVTMIFNAGQVPWYMVCRTLGLYDNIWALVIPSLLFNVFNLFLARNYIRGIPHELYESAVIDGANDLRIAYKIYFPLCQPVLATLTLFYGIGYWNNFYNASMLIENTKLYPLQMLLMQLQGQIQKIAQMSAGITSTPPSDNFKMAVCIVTIGPIVLLYPLLQKYFIKGMIVGAVKG